MKQEPEVEATAVRAIFGAIYNGDTAGAVERALELGVSPGFVDRLLDYPYVPVYDSNPLWEVLYSLAEASPDAVDYIDSKLSTRKWDGWRLLPNRWLEQLQRGEYLPHHRLVTNLVLEGDEVGLLLQEGIEASLGGLRSLGLSEVEDDILWQIGRQGWLGNIRTLQLSDIETVVSWQGMTSFSGVRELVLKSSYYPPDVLAELLVGTDFPSRTSLKLECVSTDLPWESAIRAIDQREPSSPGLDLTFTDMRFEDRWFQELVQQSSFFSNLTGFGLEFYRSTDVVCDLSPLVAGDWSPESLRLVGLFLGKDDILALAGSPWISGLKRLRLNGTSDVDGPLGRLVEALGENLEELILEHCDLGDQVAKALSRAEFPNLRVLRIPYHSTLSDEALALVFQNPSFGKLEEVDLSGSDASTLTARAIQANEFSELEVLKFGSAPSEESAEVLAMAGLPRLKNLKMVGVSQVALGDFISRGCRVQTQRFG